MSGRANLTYYVTLENPRRDKKECSRSHFPAIINVSKSEKFYLTGVVLCLNQGQEAALTASEDVLPRRAKLPISTRPSNRQLLWAYDLCSRDKNLS